MPDKNLIIALLAGGLALATTNLRAQAATAASPAMDPPEIGQQSQHSNAAQPASAASDLKASSIIGLAVRNESGERLGKVEDLIVRFTSQSVPFAIVEYGGALGIGGTRVAVPLTDLKWSSEAKELTLSATKEQFESASTTPSGAWAAIASEDCMKNVARFYGQPSINGQSRYERQEAAGMSEGREAVRNPAEQKGASGLLDPQPAANPADTNTLGTLTHDYVVDKVNAVIRQNLGANAGDIQVTVKNGKVTLAGKAASEAQKQAIENQIKAVAGVDQVENHLRTTSE